MAAVNYYCRVCGHYQWERLTKCEKCGADLSFVEEREAWPDTDGE